MTFFVLYKKKPWRSRRAKQPKKYLKIFGVRGFIKVWYNKFRRSTICICVWLYEWKGTSLNSAKKLNWIKHRFETWLFTPICFQWTELKKMPFIGTVEEPLLLSKSARSTLFISFPHESKLHQDTVIKISEIRYYTHFRIECLFVFVFQLYP